MSEEQGHLAEPNAKKVFISYAHKDEVLRKRLDTHLSLMQRQGVIASWHDRLIRAGTDWEKEIDRRLEEAEVILLLVSADFVASDYCYGIEMRRALERHDAGQALVIPILLRPVDWTAAPFARLQALPTNGKAITAWKNRDEALSDVVAGVRTALAPAPPSSASLVPIWNVPYQRNALFTGREDVLERLSQHFWPTGQNDFAPILRAAPPRPLAITGLGGIGKTQLAIEYAYRARSEGHSLHTLWVNAASQESILTSFVEIAALIPAVATRNESDQQKVIEAVKHWLEQCPQPWLLIFDNVDSEEALLSLGKYLPQKGNGGILLTTRISAVGSLATAVEVDTMGLFEGIQLLLHRAQRLDQASDEEINRAGNIVVALDHFPLALEQAGAYIEETRCGLQDYLDRYQSHRQKLLARRGRFSTGYPDSVATTWLLSFQRVQQANPAAAELLLLCSFLAPDRIPEELIEGGVAYWPPLLQQAAADRFSVDQMIEELLNYSLVKRLVQERALSIHRLVQAVQRERMEQAAQRHWAERAVQAINAVFPRDTQDVAAWSQCLRSLEQVQAAYELIECYAFAFTAAMDVLNRAGLYFDEQALSALAMPLYQRALAICEQEFGPTHPETATLLNNLGSVYKQQGKYEEAEPLYQRAVAIREQAFGATHPKMVTALNGLALLYMAQGKYEEAEPLLQRALAICEQEVGVRHHETASSLNNLAIAYAEQEKYEAAEALYQRAVAICELEVGATHPKTALSLNNLAIVYQAQGKYAEAEPLYQRALAIREQVLEPTHPEIASSLSGLGSLYKTQGKYAEAEALYQRALAIRERQWGIGHPETASSLYHLAVTYEAQGKYAEAEPLYLRMVEIREQEEGADHLALVNSLDDLAVAYIGQGKYVEAEPLLLRILAIQEQQSGGERCQIANSLDDLALIYVAQGKYAEAEPLYRQALSISMQAVGPQDANTQKVQKHYTDLLELMKQM